MPWLRLPPLPSCFLDDPAELHELGADPEPRPLYGGDVDVEAHLLVLHPEGDLPAPGREAIDIADRQDRRALEGLENRGQAVPFRGADEQDVAVAGVLDVLKPPDDERSVVDGLAAQGVIEDRAERIHPEN